MAILAIGEIRETCQKFTRSIGRVKTIAARHIVSASRNPNHEGSHQNILLKKFPKKRSQNTAKKER